MAKLYTVFLRGAAIIFGLGLTSYSAWLSWSHYGDPTGPIAATVGAGLFVFSELALVGRRWIKAGLLMGLGAMALAISGLTVYQRVASTQETRLQMERTGNLPRAMAEQALADAKEEAAKARQEATSECSSGRRTKCEGAEQREKTARDRVDEARAKLAGLGARRTEDPGNAGLAALLPWFSSEQIQRAVPAMLPLWLEACAPLLLSLGLAPGRKAPKAPAKKAKKKRRKRTPRKAAAAKTPGKTATVLPLFSQKKAS